MFNQFYDVTNSVSSIVTDKKMYMVFIGFHSNNAVTLRIADIVYLLLYIVSDRTSKQLLAVLRNKNYMHFKTILTPVVAIISVIHRGLLVVKFQPLALFSIMVSPIIV